MSDEAWKANAKRLKDWREAQVPRLSQDAAAKRIGAAQKSWSEWENAEKAPDLDNVIKLERLTDGAVPAIGWVRSRTKSERKSEPRVVRRKARRASLPPTGT